ncbi:hypothetical protein GQ53DRAFT_888933 [Thozetella sp. PMI_491]|nr:hypothetical protein GQ53DRAFT_888933 [Thozetella sp. PMI_491]
MDTNSGAEYHVYLGIWTNWSRGSALGKTLTLNRDDATLLIAFTAFFVSYVGIRAWRIICLIAHFTYSSESPQDGLYHQRQVVFRNSANPEAGLWDMLNLGYAWRRHTQRPYLRLWFLALSSFLLTGGIIVVSGFSSKISTFTGNEVLLSGTNCQAWDLEKERSALAIDQISKYFPHVSRLAGDAANYAQQCYSSNGTRVLGCGTFPLQRLPSTVTTDDECPFDQTMCKSRNGNLRIDTGLLDSHDHFGVNAPPSKRFQWRRVIRCAPIVTEGFKETVTYPNQSTTWTGYKYGSIVRTWWKFTNTSSFRVLAAIFVNGTLNQGISNLNPMPELQVPDSDINLFFLSSKDILFALETEDPWYNATNPWKYHLYFKTNNGSNTRPYFASEPASPLGCAIQEQFCNSQAGGRPVCSKLLTANDAAKAGINSVFSDNETFSMLNWWGNAAFGPIPFLSEIPAILGSHSLDSKYRLEKQGIQGPIPINQWQLDVQHWHEIYLAAMQVMLTESATGPSENMSLFYSGPSDYAKQYMCENQKILSSAHLSFSVLGVGVVVAVGGSIILVSYIIDPILTCMQKRSGKRQYQVLEWSTNGTLQLQRLAFENAGANTWSKATGSIPTTLFGQKLPLLDLSDLKHPKFRRWDTLAEVPTAVEGRPSHLAQPEMAIEGRVLPHPGHIAEVYTQRQESMDDGDQVCRDDVMVVEPHIAGPSSSITPIEPRASRKGSITTLVDGGGVEEFPPLLENIHLLESDVRSLGESRVQDQRAPGEMIEVQSLHE